MSRKRDLRQVEEATEAIGDLLVDAVRMTVAEHTPEPARECVRHFRDIDAHAAPGDESGPAQLMATLTLVRWLSLIRRELADRPQRVDEVLGWIEESLGPRYRARARYTAGALRSEDEAGEITTYLPALQEDFLPTLVWLVAGALAVHGAGEISWLRSLESGAPPAASFLSPPNGS